MAEEKAKYYSKLGVIHSMTTTRDTGKYTKSIPNFSLALTKDGGFYGYKAGIYPLDGTDNEILHVLNAYTELKKKKLSRKNVGRTPKYIVNITKGMFASLGENMENFGLLLYSVTQKKRNELKEKYYNTELIGSWCGDKVGVVYDTDEIEVSDSHNNRSSRMCEIVPHFGEDIAYELRQFIKF